ncbi:hypothetical protein EBU71_05635 [bacterium]|nr:hypothetical protein [Candidatus Elulimicrobium humile]
MAGILNAAERILDTVITTEGKRQAATGKMKVEYVSFSDAGAIYALDTLVSGGLDFTSRITFEAGNMPQDAIVFETDDSGNLLANFIDGDAGYKVRAGKVFPILTGSTRFEAPFISGSQFASLAGTLLSSSLKNFVKLSLLQSPDPLDINFNEFIIDKKDLTFKITDTKPIANSEIQEIDVDKIESIFFDKRLSHVPNFQYLPPINKPRDGSNNSVVIGAYKNLNQLPYTTYEQLANELSSSINLGYSREIEFLETSRPNNIFGQFFEQYADGFKKLDVIDFGIFPPDNNGKAHHVFFVGKVFIDSNNTPTFVNIFTLVWEL